MLLNLKQTGSNWQFLVTETNNLVSASMPFDSRYFCHHVIIRWQSHRLPVEMDVHVMKELNDNQRQLNMNNNNRWRKMIAQWSVEQEILRTTTFWSNRWVSHSAISSKNNAMSAWKSFKIILLRFASIINIISDKCPLIALNYNYTIENLLFFIVIN